jgi:hypothetical protein
MAFMHSLLTLLTLIIGFLTASAMAQTTELGAIEGVLKNARMRGFNFDTGLHQRTNNPKIIASAERLNSEMRSWFSLIDLPDNSVLATDLLIEAKKSRPLCLVRGILDTIEFELNQWPEQSDRVEIAFEVFEAPSGFFMTFKNYQSQRTGQIERELKMLWAANVGRLSPDSIELIDKQLTQIRDCKSVPLRHQLVRRAIDVQVLSELNNAPLSDLQLETNLISFFDSTFAVPLTAHRKSDWALLPSLGQPGQNLGLSGPLMQALWAVVPRMAFDQGNLTEKSCERVGRALAWVYVLGVHVTPDSITDLGVTEHVFKEWARMQMALVLGDFERVNACTAALRALEKIWPNNSFLSRDLTIKSIDGYEATRYDHYQDSSIFFDRKGFGGRYTVEGRLGNSWSAQMRLKRPEKRNEKLQIPAPSL